MEQRDETAVEGEPGMVDLLERAYNTTAEIVWAIPLAQFEASSPCAGWTVRDVGNHLVGTLDLFARVAEEQVIDPSEFTSGTQPNHLGAAPGTAVSAAADRCLRAFRRPGVLDQVFPFAFGPTPGMVIANISLSESLIHGWDMACGTGLPYVPDKTVVAAVTKFQSHNDEQNLRADGMFGPAQQTASYASQFQALLGFLGRRP